MSEAPISVMSVNCKSMVACTLLVMADARALLRAKRQEARIEHPLASYNTAGQLRCIAERTQRVSAKNAHARSSGLQRNEKS
ncbi:hypothetical protein GY45DRAFT_1331656 [Cubamyces sp. BRFM 1775]|nr:hypothetical protein GY45DRAFT_1331656 [Cubamyces sp. BRFM 1775]